MELNEGIVDKKEQRSIDLKQVFLTSCSSFMPILLFGVHAGFKGYMKKKHKTSSLLFNNIFKLFLP